MMGVAESLSETKTIRIKDDDIDKTRVEIWRNIYADCRGIHVMDELRNGHGLLLRSPIDLYSQSHV